MAPTTRAHRFAGPFPAPADLPDPLPEPARGELRLETVMEALSSNGLERRSHLRVEDLQARFPGLQELIADWTPA
ncbi:hypothetical protein [Streptomyces sp. V4I2]|uniref:hypothetical protein n=1 Tax=Streptomyces sp. V4I2 TaxID=3042280 RepID=UPI0027875A96|nr:hypothetical protein [Streptomyces sp. V4I2]MDQ1050697.1 hypothetical protein [Streptomyces sp. V4I2]